MVGIKLPGARKLAIFIGLPIVPIILGARNLVGLGLELATTGFVDDFVIVTFCGMLAVVRLAWLVFKA